MSEINSDEETGKEKIKRIDLYLKLSLPADAPDSYPHLLDLEQFGLTKSSTIDEIDDTSFDDHALSGESVFPSENPVIDVIATTLFWYNPKALEDLLNLKIEEFHWGAVSRGFEFYVDRKGCRVRVSLLNMPWGNN